MLGFRVKGIALAVAMIKQGITGKSSSSEELFTALASQAWCALSTAAVGAITANSRRHRSLKISQELASREPEYEQKKKSTELTQDFTRKSKRAEKQIGNMSGKSFGR